jgi:hypothetical protein
MNGDPQTDKLERLAGLLKKRNAVASEITAIIRRPEQIGHLGEFIASEIFGIELAESAVHKGSDGVFRAGPLAGEAVNIKWYAKKENLLDIREDVPPNYFLVMTGPQSKVMSSRGEARLWSVESVFLFDAQDILSTLRQRKVKIGIASYLGADIWNQAQVYPEQNNKRLVLTAEQRRQLQLFSALAVA